MKKKIILSALLVSAICCESKNNESSIVKALVVKSADELFEARLTKLESDNSIQWVAIKTLEERMAEQNVMKDVTEQRLRDLEVSLHGFEREGTKTSDEILQKHHIRSGILNDINKLTQEQNKIRELITQIQSTLAAGLNKQAVYDALDYLKAEDMRLQESIEKLYFQLGQVDKRVQTALVDVDDMHSGFRDRLNNKLIYLGSLSFAIPFCSFVVAFAGYGLYKLYKNCDLPKRSKIVRSALTITAMVAISLGVSYGVHNGMQIYFGS